MNFYCSYSYFTESMSKFRDFLHNKIKSEQVDPTEAKRLGHLVDIGNLNAKVLRSGRILPTVTPFDKPLNKILPKLRPETTTTSQLTKKSLSFENLDISFGNFISDTNMADFSTADFNRMIPEFKGDANSLYVFIKRCDTFHAGLCAAGQVAFLSHLIFKLSGKAFMIYESKTYNEWVVLRKDLLEGIKVSKSASALQNELMNLSQGPDKSAKEFADLIREKLKELSDILKTQYQNVEVIKSFQAEHEKIAIRAFREGLRSPLKYRIMNCDTKTLDEIVKRAVEEEPFVKVLRPSTFVDEEGNHNEGFVKNPQNKKHFFDNRQNRQVQTKDFQTKAWLERDHYRNVPRNPFFRSVMNQNNNFGDGNPNHRRDFPNERKFRNDVDNNGRDVKPETKICLRCNKQGHTSDHCYVRLNNWNNRPTNDERDVFHKMKHVSFLEAPKSSIGNECEELGEQSTEVTHSINFFSAVKCEDEDGRQIELTCIVGQFRVRLKFLIDSGAEISIIRLSRLSKKTAISRAERIKLMGIASNVSDLYSMGTCVIYVQLNNEVMLHKFHVVDDERLTLLQDAILGLDFLQINKLIIDYSNNSITFNREARQLSESNLPSEFQNNIIACADLYLQYIFLPVLTRFSLQKRILVSANLIYCPCFGCILVEMLRTVNSNNKFTCANSPLEWLLSDIDLHDIQVLMNRVPQMVQTEILSTECQLYGELFHYSALSMNGSMISEMKCSNCKLFSTNATDFLKIRCLPFETVQASISFFFTKQLLELNDQHCPSCSWKHTCYVQHHLTVEPNFLYVSIQRNRDFRKSEIQITNIDIQRSICWKIGFPPLNTN